LDHPGTVSALKCAVFWKDRLEGEMPADTFEKGEYLLSQWRTFMGLVEGSDVPEELVHACRQHVLRSALNHYLCLRQEGPGEEPELLYRIGRCYKGMGNFELAIECLEGANRGKPEDAAVLAELADCYSLVNESRAAKVFFREAFFLDPQAVDLGTLESPLIRRLAEKVGDLGYSGPEVNEWLPVYAMVYGVFNVKREMKPLELGKLKQSIFQLRNEIEIEPRARGLAPRLINRYFWLIDHYLTVGETKDKVEEVLDRIREIDPRVYREYAT
jgi:tetratricopeptide (TPR) repeat protein